ncbi:MAG: GntR family transcriptional regulator [Clostridia bacterium]|nr:GntR family transcriptional regulator [Clostridia bacterium]
MSWSFSSGSPVYLQIAERMKKSVLAGEYLAGAQVPTVRQLALEAAVNPNTVQRAYTELEAEGIIESRGTMGNFVTEEQQRIDECRKKLAEDIVLNFLNDMNQLSVNTEEAIRLIREVTE